MISARIARTVQIFGALLFMCASAHAETVAAVAGNHPAMVEKMVAAGRLEAQRPLSMSVTLALRNRDQLQQLIEDQQNPASPEYHHFLAPGEFDARFGPTNFDEVRDWLTSQGFTVTGANPATRAIQFTGTVAQAEQAFNVAIESFGGVYFGNATDPQIPARFAAVIGHIHGLDNMSAKMPGVTPSRLELVAPASETEPETDAGNSAPGFNVPGIGITLFGPSDFYTFYHETPLLSSGLKGSGCIGIVGDSNYLPSAVARFDSRFKVSGAHITTVHADPGNSGFNDDEVEAELDLEWSHAVAPDADTRYYLGNDATSLNALGDAIGAAVSEDRCAVISISFGFCGEIASFYTEGLDPIFMRAAAQGQSIITITHDYGAAYLTLDSTTRSCVAGTTQAVSEMAADPHVTAISGTSFTPDWDSNGNIITGIPERVWNDPNDGIASGNATGGGVSAIFAKPGFQNAPGVPADGMRDVPDVSLLASPNFPGAWLVTSTSCFNENTGCTGKGGLSYAQVGGTSLSAPSFAGIANLVGQAAGTSLGNMDPTIYALATKDAAGSGFRDVTMGNNDFNGVTGFAAGTGYDLCTGWGTIDATEFLTAYANTLPGPSQVTLTPTSLSFKNVKSGTTSKPKTVTIAVAKGQKAWTQITSVSGGGEFVAAETCVGSWIGPGKSCKFGVTFSPSAPGPVASQMLTVSVSPGTSPAPIALTGSGK
jgi:subtilase family serine protease